jgi:inner membrane protease ATP23
MRSAGLFSPNEPDPSSPTGGQVKLCADSLASKAHLEDVLSHELIHAYDHRRFDIDWTNLRHIACTEVRFVSLAFSSLASMICESIVRMKEIHMN